MVGTVMPLITLPDVTWRAFPVATLEGQYIIKNVVLVAGGIVLGGANLDGRRRPRRARPERVDFRTSVRTGAVVGIATSRLLPPPAGRSGSAVRRPTA